jgi:DNA-binding IclR family transcriptional regulator
MHNLHPSRNTVKKTVSYFSSLRKGLSVLKCFSPQQMELSGAEIARIVGMHRTSAYRILSVLEDQGLVERVGKRGKYTVGPSLYALGSIYLDATELTKAAAPVLSKLNELTTEVVTMSIRDNRNIVLIAKEESRHLVRFPHHIGAIFPACATPTGRALLSDLTEEEIDRLFPEEELEVLPSRIVLTRTQLKRELAITRETGVSVVRVGPIAGLGGIAALVRNCSGTGVAAISFGIPTSAMVSSRCKEMSDLIRLGASLISYRLGFQNGHDRVRDLRELISWWERRKRE